MAESAKETSNRSGPSGKNEQGDFGKFTDFMRKLVAVPHSEIKAKLDAEKQESKQRKKRVFRSRASHAKC